MPTNTASRLPVGREPVHPSTWEDFSIPADFGYTEGGTSIRTLHEVDWSPLSSRRKPWMRCYLWLTSQGLSLIVGSGGSAGCLFDEDPAWDSITTTAMPKDLLRALGKPEVATAAAKATASAVLSTADLVAAIKATLGMKVIDLAAIAKVSRQTLYDWIDGGPISPKNSERLFALRRICVVWRALAQKPLGPLAHAKTEDGTSLFDLLQRDELNELAIRTLLETLAAKAAESEAARSQRNRKLDRLGEKAYRENLLSHSRPVTDS